MSQHGTPFSLRPVISQRQERRERRTSGAFFCDVDAVEEQKLIQVLGNDISISGRILRIARLEADSYESFDRPQAIIADLRTCGSRIDLFTFMQIMPDTSPKYAYPYIWDNLAVLSISTFDCWWKQQLRSEARNRARQAEKKGVTVKEVALDDALTQGIWEIYNECPMRQNRVFPHFGKDIKTVQKISSTFPETSIFIGAFLGEKLIGFARLVTDRKQSHANIMSIVSMMKHKEKAPTNALIAQAVRSCSERGIKYLSYQKYAYGKKEDGLTNFKHVNGFQKIDLPRYYVPLTYVGWIALRLGLHHRFTDYIPEPVLAGVRRLRSALNYYRYQTAMVDS
jgi:hypothetical protein